MATQTFQHSSFANGLVTVEFEVNDANWRVGKVRCINNSALPAAAMIYKAGVAIMEVTAAPGETSSWNVSGVQLGWQPDYWDSTTNQYEASGIDMKDYTISVRWPA